MSNYVTWQWGDWITVALKCWSNYLYNMRVECKHHTVNGVASFKCIGVELNWEQQH